MEQTKEKRVCAHCGAHIVLSQGNAWHGTNLVFPQYCWVDPMHGSQLHEPKPTGFLPRR